MIKRLVLLERLLDLFLLRFRAEVCVAFELLGGVFGSSIPCLALGLFALLLFSLEVAGIKSDKVRILLREWTVD